MLESAATYIIPNVVSVPGGEERTAETVHHEESDHAHVVRMYGDFNAPREIRVLYNAVYLLIIIMYNIYIYRSGPERVRHAFGVYVLPETHYAADLRVETVDGVAPERQNVSLAENARHVRVCPSLPS